MPGMKDVTVFLEGLLRAADYIRDAPFLLPRELEVKPIDCPHFLSPTQKQHIEKLLPWPSCHFHSLSICNPCFHSAINSSSAADVTPTLKTSFLSPLYLTVKTAVISIDDKGRNKVLLQYFINQDYICERNYRESGPWVWGRTSYPWRASLLHCSSFVISFIENGHGYIGGIIYVGLPTASKNRPYPQDSVLEGDGDRNFKNFFSTMCLDWSHRFAAQTMEEEEQVHSK